MTISEKQVYKCKIYLILKLSKLEEEYKNTKGYSHIPLARKIKKLKKQIGDRE